MTDVSGIGFIIHVSASRTFPTGFSVSQFADDGDPFDIPEIEIADKAMGLNGDLVVWAKVMPISLTLNVVPNSDDDLNLSAILEANRIGKGKTVAGDEITISGIYPNGDSITLQGGRMMSGAISPSIATSGRMKSKKFTFIFENKVGS